MLSLIVPDLKETQRMTQRNLLKIKCMGMAQTYIDYLESEYVTQRNVLKKVQKELTERQ